LITMAYEVTIGIPVYNVEKYIRLTMDSALAQTFDSIEFLVLDDCGTDSSMDIVREYQQTHPRGKDIRIVRQPQNMGIGMARNRIIDEAQGHYLFFMDADDEMPNDSIKRLYHAAQQYSAQIVYGSNERIYDFDGRKRIEKDLYRPMQFLHGDDFAEYAYDSYGNIPANVWKYLIDIHVYRDNHLRFPDINYWEDFIMTMDLPTYITRAVFISDVIYRYFCRYGTLSNYQQRSRIDKSEIRQTLDAMYEVKQMFRRLKPKSYFHKWLYKVMMTHFYMVCAVLKEENVIVPSFTNKELRDVIQSPLSMSEILRLKGWHLKILFLYFLGVLPPVLSVMVIRLLGKLKGLV